MDNNTIMAAISAQTKLVDSIPIDQNVITEIDRHIKYIEQQLNDRLIHIPANVIIQNFLPIINKRGDLPSKVDDKIWESISFSKTWHAQEALHEELFFDRHSKGLSFFYTLGDVTFDLGVEEYEGVDWYLRIKEDKRKTYKLTGAPVEIKLRAFLHLEKLLMNINLQASQIMSNIQADLTKDAFERFPSMQVLAGWNRFHKGPF